VRLPQDLTKLLIVEKPAEPFAFLAEHLERKARVQLPSEAGACGTEEDATSYLSEHRLPQVLEELVGRLLFERPEDPEAFLAEQLRAAAAAGAGGAAAAAFFSDDDLRGMFTLFDPTGRGTVSPEQALAGARSVGVSLTDDDAPSGSADGGGLTEDEFVAWARGCVDASRVL